jgi:hypothetical protein
VRRGIDELSMSVRDSPLQSKPFIVLMLLFTFALGLHVQLARYNSLSVFPASHILHGDLRPDSGQPARVLAAVDGAMALAAVMGLFALAGLRPHLIGGFVLSSTGFSVGELLIYLAMFVRPPPLCRQAT